MLARRAVARHLMTVALLALLSTGVGVAKATPTATPATPASTSSCSLAPTGGLVTRTVDGRPYLLYVPANLTGSASLVLSLHGALVPARLYALFPGWQQFADSHNLIVAVPQGAPIPILNLPLWNAAPGSPDVHYLRRVVADVSATWCVNPRHVHAEGTSNGALMAARLACDAADVFASVAPFAGGPASITGACIPSRPISIGIFQAALDPLSSILVGIVSRDEWLARNGCPRTPVREPNVLLEAARYGPCNAGVEVVWRVYLLQSHNWPIGADGVDLLNRMWALFQANPLPGGSGGGA